MDLISSCTMAIFASSLVIFFLFYFLQSSWLRLLAFVNGFFIYVVFAFRVLLSSFWLTMINIVFVSMCLCVCRLLGVSCHIQGSPACTMSVGFVMIWMCCIWGCRLGGSDQNPHVGGEVVFTEGSECFEGNEKGRKDEGEAKDQGLGYRDDDIYV